MEKGFDKTKTPELFLAEAKISGKEAEIRFLSVGITEGSRILSHQMIEFEKLLKKFNQEKARNWELTNENNRLEKEKTYVTAQLAEAEKRERNLITDLQKGLEADKVAIKEKGALNDIRKKVLKILTSGELAEVFSLGRTSKVPPFLRDDLLKIREILEEGASVLS